MNIQREENVFPMVPGAVRQNPMLAIQQSLQAQEAMIANVKAIVEEVMDIREEVVELHKQITDENRLLPSECDELYEAVRIKSTEIVKRNFEGDDSEFTKAVGKMRTKIWRKVNKKFGASKYIHIRRKDFRDAVDYVRNFSLLNEV